MKKIFGFYVKIILETGEFLIEKTEYTPSYGCSIGYTEGVGNYYSIISPEKKIELAKLLVVEYAINEERKKLAAQQGIVQRLQAAREEIFP